MSFARRFICSLLIMAFVSASVNLSFIAVVYAQPAATLVYRVAPGDRIFLSVPQRTDLNRQLLVKPDGKVSLPLIGDVDVNGLTSPEIETRLLQALRDYYPSIQRIQITITEALSGAIYVSGQVRNPGKYSFPVSPNVWEVIREAGGPTAGASLNNVRIVKDRTRGGTSILVNVLAAIEGGLMDSLPELESGDTVIVPSQDEIYTGTFGVNISGVVQNPGVFRLQARQDLMSALLLAGGPGDGADVTRIRIIRPRNDGSVATIQVDLEDFLFRGDPLANPKLLPGDTVHLPRQSRLTKLFTTDIASLVSITTAIITMSVLIISLQDDN